ncbi:MAG: hypothetical protein II809_08020 [Bacteroidales bacterium]|nr:hypothetical protein [Bacteroidales bacterium]
MEVFPLLRGIPLIINTFISIQFGFYLVQGVEKKGGGYGRAQQQNAEGVPSEHMPLGGIWPFDAKFYGLGL